MTEHTTVDSNINWDGPTNRQPIAIAYGLLWLFQGNSEERPHDELAFSARRHLRNMLLVDECKFGIAFAKDIAAAKGVSIEPPAEWMAGPQGCPTCGTKAHICICETL